MEITSFILGIIAVIVVSSLAGIGYLMFKVHKLKNVVDGHSADIDHSFKRIEEVNVLIRQNNSFQWDRFKSEMDSRIDKLLLRIQPTGNQTGSKDGNKQLLDKQILND